MHKNLIITFTRNPELGKVKSRLAKGIGETSALEIYKFLLEHTKNVLSKLDCDRAVYYSVKIRENDIWDSEVFSKHQQFGGDDLGARMQNAFDNGFKKGYEKIIIVGSDLYDLNTEIINQAFKKLDTNDNVIGPAEDGGYYLLGMKTLNPSVFDIENWGTETVYKQTVSKLTSSLYVLETLNDIDYVEDLKPYDIFKKYLK